jgi:hypothetical protein
MLVRRNAERKPVESKTRNSGYELSLTRRTLPSFFALAVIEQGFLERALPMTV